MPVVESLVTGHDVVRQVIRIVVPSARRGLLGEASTAGFDLGREARELARAAGLDLPFSCKSGVCSTCRARLQKGTVSMTRNFALMASDLAAGFILTCQAHPTSPDVTISFDDR